MPTPAFTPPALSLLSLPDVLCSGQLADGVPVAFSIFLALPVARRVPHGETPRACALHRLFAVSQARESARGGCKGVRSANYWVPFL